MSVYPVENSPFYHSSFQLDGHRVHRTTKCTTKREAKVAEQQIREDEKAKIAANAAAAGSLRLDDAGGGYWIEIGQHHAGADNTERLIGWVIGDLGKNTMMTEITDAVVAGMVSRRRLDRVPNSKPVRFISPATVNDTTEQLKKLFTYKKKRGAKFPNEPTWRNHKLPEPKERPRELHEDERERLDAVMRDDYAPLFDYVRTAGKRKTECYTLQWPHVHWDTGWIERPGKGGRTVRVQITDTIREILWPLRGHHPEFVFTYVAERTRGGRVKGQRYPITLAGLNTRWRRMQKKAELKGFRFHDFRHDVATKLLRETGNLKLVSKALDHASIATTMRYAHILDDEIGAALEVVAQKRRKHHPINHPTPKLKVV